MNDTIKREQLNFLLQKADFNILKQLCEKIEESHEIKILQPPVEQTLLQPIYDPVSEGKFYAGEILVTTAIVQLGENSAAKGWAMVQDKNEELSFCVAVCDAAFAADFFKKEITELIVSTEDKLQLQKKQINKRVNATRVKFDLMS